VNNIVEGDAKSLLGLVKESMDLVIKHYEKEILSIRTGKASAGLVENIKADVYGQMMSIREVASIATPDSRLIVIQPWDKSVIGAIDKAIQNSDLGINPVNDGDLLRLQIPMMSTERREDLVKVLSKKTEDARVGIRNVRKDFNNKIRDAEKDRVISQDFSKKLSEQLQKSTDAWIEKVSVIKDKKESDLRAA
jgi:ribosome recycling factor